MATKIPSPIAVMDLPIPPGKKASDYLNSYKSWVFSATQATSEKVASSEIKLYKKVIKNKKMEIEEVDEHECLSLLYDVNDFMTNYHLREITQIYLDLTGECYWALLREDDSKSPSEIWPLRPDWVTVIPSKENFIEGYKYSPGGGLSPEAVTFKPQDIIPFKYPNPLNPYRGRGQVQGADMAIDIDTFSAQWNRNYFFNSALPSLVFSTEKNLTQAQIDRFVEAWMAKFQGVQNAHKVAVMGAGLKPEKISNTPNEMAFPEQRRMMRDEILGIFRVPKSVIGITEDVNLANAQASERSFAEHVIKPRLIRFVAYLNEFYLTNWPDENLFFDYENPVPEDTELKLKVYENGIKNGWLTINEVREEENRPPVDGGDSVYMPLILQPIGQVQRLFGKLTGKKAEEEAGMLVLPVKGESKAKRKFQMPVPPMRLAQLRSENLRKEIKHDLKKLVMNLMAQKNGDEPKEEQEEKRFLSGWDEKRREDHWYKLIAKTDVFEQRILDMMRPLFSEQEQEVDMKVQNLFKSYKSGKRKFSQDDVAGLLFNLIAENKRWQSVLSPYIRNIVEDKGEEVLDFLGVSGSLDLTQITAAAYLRLDGVNFIKDVNKTTRDALRETLSQGLQKEESINQMKKRVADVFEQARGYRAERIARTEVARSTTFATLEAYRQSEIVEMKEWLTAADERVEEDCASLEGLTVPLDETFRGEDGPPLHPNCRCTVIPVIKSSGRSNSPKSTKSGAKIKETPEVEVVEVEKAKKEVDEYLVEKKEKVIKEAKQEAEKEKKEIVGEVRSLRDKLRNVIHGQK